MTKEHPEITFRTDALLRSINDRLGSLLVALSAERAGMTIPPLRRTFIGELYEFAKADSEDAEDALDEGRKNNIVDSFDRLKTALEDD